MTAQGLHIRQLWLWLLVTAGITVAAMVAGVLYGNQPLVFGAGGMFLFAAVFAGGRLDRAASVSPASQQEDATADPSKPRASPVAETSARYALLLATVWGWSGAAMLCCYYLTDLAWQHAWQYGAAMVLIAGLLIGFAHQRLDPESPVSGEPQVRLARWATAAQGLAAAAAVVWLLMSGKLQAASQDWAANIVFVAGGLAVAQLSFMALAAERRARTLNPQAN